MALTRKFKDTVIAKIQRDPDFGVALLTEGIQCLLEGDLDTGKAVLKDYINATIGFEALGAMAGIPPKSLLRMFGPKGNPQARKLFTVISKLQESEGLRLKIAS